MTNDEMNAEQAGIPARREKARAARFPRAHRVLIVMLAVSACLRFALVLRGGQYYYSDEHRYSRGAYFINHLLHGGWAKAVDEILFRNPQQGDRRVTSHMGFGLLATVPAAFQGAWMLATGRSADETLWAGAMVLSLASVACVGLTYGVARRAGAGKGEALTAAGLAALAATMLYYSRHLLAYDLSLMLALLALWQGLSPGRAARHSVLCGLFAGMAFWGYYGYWTVAGIAVLVHLLPQGKRGQAPFRTAEKEPDPPGVNGQKGTDTFFQTTEKGVSPLLQASPFLPLRRGLLMAAGFAAMPAVLTAMAVLRGASPLLVVESVLWNSGKVTYGDYAEGWRLPWEFLWHAEGGMLVVWIVGAGLALLPAGSGRPVPRRAVLWLAVAAGIYAALAVTSTGLGRFVVFGRLARQMVPFLCLACACGLARAFQWLPARRAVLTAAVIAGTALFAVNVYPTFRQQWPRDFRARADELYGHCGWDLTISGPTMDAERVIPESRYVVLNVGLMWPVEGEMPPPPGRVVMSARHPLQFLPYQYEGWGPEERAILRATDISMRVVERHLD